MKVIVVCEDNSTFEFSSVLIYPYWSPADNNEYQIRISHGTVFGNSQQDYAIFKCEAEIFRDKVHETLNKEYMKLVAQKWGEGIIGWIKMESIIKEALNEE